MSYELLSFSSLCEFETLSFLKAEQVARVEIPRGYQKLHLGHFHHEPDDLLLTLPFI